MTTEARNEKPYYLAGPMTGIPQFNYPMFDAAASILRTAGWEVQSPAELDDAETQAAARASVDGSPHDTAGHTWGDFLARDVKLLADECGGVILLPGWERSRGAKLEAFVTCLCGMPIFYYNHGNPSPADADDVANEFHQTVMARGVSA